MRNRYLESWILNLFQETQFSKNSIMYSRPGWQCWRKIGTWCRKWVRIGQDAPRIMQVWSLQQILAGLAVSYGLSGAITISEPSLTNCICDNKDWGPSINLIEIFQHFFYCHRKCVFQGNIRCFETTVQNTLRFSGTKIYQTIFFKLGPKNPWYHLIAQSGLGPIILDTLICTCMVRHVYSDECVKAISLSFKKYKDTNCFSIAKY